MFDYLRIFICNIAFIIYKTANFVLPFYNLFANEQKLLVNLAKGKLILYCFFFNLSAFYIEEAPPC